MQRANKWISLALILAMFIPLAAILPAEPARADDIFSDDFDSYANGTLLSTSPGGWFQVYNGGGDVNQHIDNTRAVSGTQSVTLAGTHSRSAMAYHAVSFPDRFWYEAMVYSGGSAGIENGWLGLSSADYLTWYGTVRFNADGYIDAWNGSYTQLTTYTPGSWYKIRVYMDLVSRTFDVYVNGTLRGSKIPLGYAGTPTGIFLESGNFNVQVWFDDVKVYTGLANTAWPMLHHDARHTGQSTNLGAQINNLKWSYATGSGNGIDSSPAVGSEGTIYFGANDQLLYAVNPDGSTKWTYNQATGGGRLRSSPAIGMDGTIYVGGANDGYLHAITDNGTVGNMKWKTYTTTINTASPVIGSDGTIYVGTSNNGRLYAIADNGTAGNVKWYYPTGSIESCPAIGSDGTIYVCSDNGTLWALADNVTSGFLKWHRNLGTFGYSPSPAIAADGTIYVGAGGILYAISDNGTAGNDKWSYATASIQLQSPAIASGSTVYIGATDGKLYAITDNGTAGNPKWIVPYQAGSAIYSHPAIGSDGIIYLSTENGNIYALTDTGTAGNTKWSYSSGRTIYTSPAIGSGHTVYVTGGTDFQTGYLVAIGGSTAPTVATDNATSIMANTAILHGNLGSTGGSTTTVVIYSGITDGLENPDNWARSDNLSSVAAGPFSLGVTGLPPNTTYFYRCYAENSEGGSWAPSSVSFTTQADLGLWRNYWAGPGRDWFWFSSGGP